MSDAQPEFPGRNPCHLLDYELRDGPANMALDEALLDFVAARGETAFLRTYGWSIPTLSLGYFQNIHDARALQRWAEVPTVRRLSGGGAIWHHHEVTYTLVVPASHPLARPSTSLYRAVHGAITGVLLDLGVPAAPRGSEVRSQDFEASRPFLCFTDSNPEDIVAYGVKIVGSAQRRRGGAVLQHGSILLARSRRTPELLGVCDVADVPAEPLDWSARIMARIPGHLGLRPMAVPVPEDVHVRAAELERIRYRHPGWTQLR